MTLRQLFLVGLLGASLLTLGSAAGVPLQLAHQGRLLDSQGDPVAGPVDLHVRIFAEDEGGNPLWEELHSSVSLIDGLFSIQLGSVTPLSPDILRPPTDSPATTSVRYLEFQVGNDPPIAPRVQLVSSPYCVAAHRMAGDVYTGDGSLILLDPSTQDTTIRFDGSDGSTTHKHSGGGGGGAGKVSFVAPGGSHWHDSFFDITYRIDVSTSSDSGAYLEVAAVDPAGSSSRSISKATPKLYEKAMVSTDGSSTKSHILRADSSGSSAQLRDSFFDITYDLQLHSSSFGSEVKASTLDLDDFISTRTQMRSQPRVAEVTLELEDSQTQTVLHDAGMRIDSLGSHHWHGDSFFDITYRIDSECRDTAATRRCTSSDLTDLTTTIVSDKATPKLAEALCRTTTPTKDLFISMKSDTAGSRCYAIDSFFDITYRLDMTPQTGLELATTDNDSALYGMTKAQLVDVLQSGDVDRAIVRPSRFEMSRLPAGETVPIEIVALSLSSLEPIVAVRSPNSLATDLPAWDLRLKPNGDMSRILRSSATSSDSSVETGGSLSLHGVGGSLSLSSGSLQLRSASSPFPAVSFDVTGTLEARGRCGLALEPTASVGIGTTTPLVKLQVDGQICHNGIFMCSDKRYKKNIEEIQDASAILDQLTGVRFDWRIDEFQDKEFTDDRQIGFIAQDVVKVLPEAVLKTSDGFYNVDYGRLTPVLVEALKAQKSKVANLESEVAKLKAMLIQLTEAIEKSESSKTASR